MRDNRQLSDLLEMKTSDFFIKNSRKDIEINQPELLFLPDDIYLLKVKRITFEKNAPRKEALENVFSAMRFVQANLVYIIHGRRDGVTFYYGVAQNLFHPRGPEGTIRTLGAKVLKKCFESNFRGSYIEVVQNTETERLIREINAFSKVGVLEGVAGSYEEDNESFQRVDRLIDAMLGDDFVFLVTSKQIDLEGINCMEDNVYQFYNNLTPLSKFQHQQSKNQGQSDTKGSSKSNTSSNSYGSNSSRNDSQSQMSSGSEKSHATSFGSSTTKSSDFINKRIVDWLTYTDEVTLKRLDHGKGKGIFRTAITMFSNSDLVLQKLSVTAATLFSGEKGNKMPLSGYNIDSSSDQCKMLRSFQIPTGIFLQPISDDEVFYRTSLSQCVSTKRLTLGNWCSISELSVVAGLPSKEVVGLDLNEEVEFGVNPNYKNDIENQLSIGNMVHGGIVNSAVNVCINRDDLSKHVFVCGVTGSGKTTTCMSLLTNSMMPYLVVEPAKTEYRSLLCRDSDVLVFTLGDDSIAPFRLNPLEFLPTESISSHVDMIKASIESAFDMEAAIPQIIEAALYECYKEFGWDIYTGKNSKYPNPFDGNCCAFPTLSDLISTTETVVDRQGFDERLRNDYVGSIKARLLGLTVGAKGAMLNTPRSIDFRNLVHKKVVLELDCIRSGNEKSLIMGFILSQLNEAIRSEHKKDKMFRHITLIEEAHRLLSKYIPGDSPNKKNGVEVFSDMLAEIRKYGESLIISDQIPDKMTPEVLKNTNIKIVHRLFAQDDKDAIGNTMSLTQEQKSFLSNLVTGRAIVFSQGWSKSVQAQIFQTIDTSVYDADDNILRDNAIKYYFMTRKTGVFPELTFMKKPINEIQANDIWDFIQKSRTIAISFHRFIWGQTKYRDELASIVKSLLDECHTEAVAWYVTVYCFIQPDDSIYNLVLSVLQDASCGMLEGNDYKVTYRGLFQAKNKKSIC